MRWWDTTKFKFYFDYFTLYDCKLIIIGELLVSWESWDERCYQPDSAVVHWLGPLQPETSPAQTMTIRTTDTIFGSHLPTPHTLNQHQVNTHLLTELCRQLKEDKTQTLEADRKLWYGNNAHCLFVSRLLIFKDDFLNCEKFLKLHFPFCVRLIFPESLFH